MKVLVKIAIFMSVVSLVQTATFGRGKKSSIPFSFGGLPGLGAGLLFRFVLGVH
jgi:hypothetical protein